MPAISSGKVLVSGANGYVAVWVVRTLLEEGFSVRGAVRSADKGKHLTNRFASHGDKFELVVVPDITQDGAFDDAVKGVDAIAHTASPFHFQANEPAELIEPAVKGTVGILGSARKYGKSVKRVVVTSSCASVLSVLPTPKTFSEEDWNDGAVAEVKEKGAAASAASKYRTSKVLAERVDAAPAASKYV
ncbi:NAD(P)-binding protein [Mycena filopes]|nr:NAD(P)-binding protein [Mycena filopes]